MPSEQEAVEAYYYYGTLPYATPMLMAELGIEFNDIASRPGEIWYAVDGYNLSSYIQAYSLSGNLLESVPSSLIPQADGLTFDSEGFLWVSDAVNDKIYKVDVNVSTSLERCTWGAIKSGF